jgi:hypothetical protein
VTTESCLDALRLDLAVSALDQQHDSDVAPRSVADRVAHLLESNIK